MTFTVLMKDLIVMLNGQVEDMTNPIVAQLLYLESVNKEKVLSFLLIVPVVLLSRYGYP